MPRTEKCRILYTTLDKKEDRYDMKFKKFVCEKETINGMEFDILPITDSQILLQRRKELNLTQLQVAEAAGIQLRQYQRVENGESSISGSSARIVLSICEALQLDPYLFFGKGNEDMETTTHDVYVVLPQIETRQGVNGKYYYIPQLAYYLMVSAIPYGKVCTKEEIWDKLKEVYGIDTVDTSSDYNSVSMYGYSKFPFWRAVADNGYITGSFYVSKDRLIELLQQEGHNIRQVGNTQRFRLMDFDDTHYNVNDMKISVLQTDEQILETMKKCMSAE